MAHNAGFDIAFINTELKRADKPPMATERVIDTLVLARRKCAGGHNTLDELCMRYDLNRSHRTQHGALLDAELLGAVYVELTPQLEPIKSSPASVHAIVGARPHIAAARDLAASEIICRCYFVRSFAAFVKSSMISFIYNDAELLR